MLEVYHLRQIRRLHRRSQPYNAAVRALAAGQHIQQRGLSRAVLAQQSDALAPLAPQIHILKQPLLAEGLADALDLQYLVALELPALEPRLQPPRLRGLRRGPHTFNALLHAEGPLVQRVVAHEGPQVHLLRRLFQLRDLRLLLQVLLHTLLIPPFLLDGIKAVISAVKLRFSALYLDDPRHGPVQEIPVMADGQHRAPEPPQIPLQPLRGLQVQMVRGLVQQQDVRILQNEPSQVHPGLLSAGQTREFPLPHFPRDAQAVGHLVHRRLRVPAAQSLEFGVQLAVPPQRIRAAVPLLHPQGQRVHLILQPEHPRKGRLQNVLHRVPLRIHGDLRDQSHPPSGGDLYLSLVRLQLPSEHTEHRGLSGAVPPQQSHALPAVHLKAQSVQYSLFQIKGLHQPRNANVDHLLFL